jgi:hypothetical protein
MPRLATKLTPAANGGFVARKVIPRDVRDEYAKRYGQRTEERLNTGPMAIAPARTKHREWSNEIEVRIANIRAFGIHSAPTSESGPSVGMSGDALLCCTRPPSELHQMWQSCRTFWDVKKLQVGTNFHPSRLSLWDGWGSHLLSPLQSWMRKLGAPT